MNGFTQKVYDRWRASKGLPKRDVREIDDLEKEAIAYEEFWVYCNCEALPEPLSHAVFDMAFHSGPWNAKLALQDALRVKMDGVIGERTVAAAKETPDAMLRFLKKRAAFIQEVIIKTPSQAAFLEGWTNRLLELAWHGASWR